MEPRTEGVPGEGNLPQSYISRVPSDPSGSERKVIVPFVSLFFVGHESLTTPKHLTRMCLCYVCVLPLPPKTLDLPPHKVLEYFIDGSINLLSDSSRSVRVPVPLVQFPKGGTWVVNRRKVRGFLSKVGSPSPLFVLSEPENGDYSKSSPKGPLVFNTPLVSR